MATRDLRSYSSLKARENNKEAQSLKDALSSLRFSKFMTLQPG